MENKILIAYATLHGATQEIAEAVGDELCRAGVQADVLPARSARSLSGYSALVLGASLYMFHFHNDAARFLRQHRRALTGGLPAVLFAGGLYVSDTPADRQEVQRQITAELARTPWFQPLAVHQVGGRFDPNHLRFPYNLIPALRQAAPADVRDWTAIRAWAAGLPALFDRASVEKPAVPA